MEEKVRCIQSSIHCTASCAGLEALANTKRIIGSTEQKLGNCKRLKSAIVTPAVLPI